MIENGARRPQGVEPFEARLRSAQCLLDERETAGLRGHLCNDQRREARAAIISVKQCGSRVLIHHRRGAHHLITNADQRIGSLVAVGLLLPDRGVACSKLDELLKLGRIPGDWWLSLDAPV